MGYRHLPGDVVFYHRCTVRALAYLGIKWRPHEFASSCNGDIVLVVCIDEGGRSHNLNTFVTAEYGWQIIFRFPSELTDGPFSNV